MDTITAPSATNQSGLALVPMMREAHASGVSWAAVIAGAFVAAALSLALLTLGVGLGLSSVSPWSNAGASAAAVGIAGIVWLIVMHAIASAMGGYLAGRLRTKWPDAQIDEVFFRDTAHGFLVWAVGLVITASFLASAATSIVGGATQAGATALSAATGGAVATNAATNAMNRSEANTLSPQAYFADALLRTERPEAVDASARTEVGRIFANGLRYESMPPADRTYLAQLISARTGLSQADADRRVNDMFAQAKNAEMEARQAADTARKAAASLSLWTFVALLIGAFCASYAATIGGRQRDR